MLSEIQNKEPRPAISDSGSFQIVDLTSSRQQEINKTVEQNEEVKKISEPFFFSKLLYNKPHIVFFGCLTFILILVGSVFGFGLFNIIERKERDFYVYSDIRIQRDDAFDLAVEEYNEYLQKQDIPAERSVENDFLQTFIIYEAKKGTTLLTPENIKTMQKVEKYFQSYKDDDGTSFQDLCLAKSTSDSSCADPSSLPAILAGSLENEPSQDQINGFLNYAKSDDMFYQNISILFDENFSQSNTKVKIARSIYNFGFPLKGFKDTVDEDDKQYDIFKIWTRKFFEYIEEGQSTDTLEVRFFNVPADFDYSITQVNKDIIFSMFAGGFVAIYMVIHTKSFAIGIFSNFLMWITFPAAFFLYEVVFQIKYFAALHISVLFLLMGIGADDVFVFFDQFQQAGLIPGLENNLLRRTSYAYRKASMAMLITSATTIISFLATAISKLMPIKTYGFFAAITIATNYILVITIFPAFLVIREKCLIKQREKKLNQGEKQLQQSPKKVNSFTNQVHPSDTEQRELNSQENEQQKDEVPEKKQLQEQKLTKIQQFFEKYWNNYVYKFRYPIIILFLGLISFNFYAVAQLDTPKEPPSFAKDQHFLFKALTSLRQDFPKGKDDGNSIEISMIWGIKDVNQDNMDFYDPSDQGKVIYDNSFDLSKTVNQQRLYDICQELRQPEYKKYVSQDSQSLTCFMEVFQNYRVNQNLEFPVSQEDFVETFSNFIDNTNEGYNIKQNDEISIINGRIKYVRISFIGNVQALNGRGVLEPLYDDFQDIMENINKNSGPGLNKGFQTSQSWLWMVSEKELLNGAIQGIIISLSLAFVILMLSTMNIIVSIFSILCITGVVSGVLMIIWAQGWDFGTFESMNSIIIIGLSVDYIVHLANTYTESEEKDKNKRTRDMMTVMGVSVIGGGITTLGGGLFLFGGELRFFLVMGVLVCATIGFSLAWSLLFFPALCYIAGPSNNTGNIKVFINKLRNKKEIQIEDKENEERKDNKPQVQCADIELKNENNELQ